MSIQIIQDYFPELSSTQLAHLNEYAELLVETNASINLISRKSESDVWVNHILHSLSIAKVAQFRRGDRVLDVGTGGGLPGIPLAIFFPETKFLLVDSIGKKVKAVESMAKQLGLTNVDTQHARVEDIPHEFNHVVSRAVTAFPKFLSWFDRAPIISDERSLAGGVYYIKGGDFEQELNDAGVKYRTWEISDWFSEEFFETKKVVWVKLS